MVRQLLTGKLAADSKGAYNEPTGLSRLETGICPNGCTQCHIGGEAIAKRNDRGKDKSHYGPVPGGRRNCVRCRFFVTGLPFLIPLWAHATAILARVDTLSKRIASTRGEVEELKQQRLAVGAKPVPQSLSDRIRILDETWVGELEARDQALADAHATMVLIEKIRAISSLGSGDDGKLPMLLNSESTPEITSRETTRFELVDAVVQTSRWFPSMQTAELERERDAFLDKILYRNGYVPITLSPLSANERRQAADALAQMFIAELGAAEAQNLIDGRKTLVDFGLQDKLEMAASHAIGRPTERLSLTPPVEPLVIETPTETTS